MSTSNKTQFEVQAVIRSNILSGLTALGHNGWEVMEFGQASLQKADKVILMRLIGNGRMGWQSQKYGTIQQQFKRTDEYVDEQSWQISVILKRNDNTTDASLLSTDIANQLISWFNGPGCDYFRRNGMASLRIDSDKVLVYNDNSDLYQKRAVFTMKIQVPKELSFGQTELESIKPGIYPI